MKNISEFLNECINTTNINNVENPVEEPISTPVQEAEETIKSEDDFREAARAKFKEVFGDELDEEKMNETIDGLLEDNKDLVEKGEWGELIGMLNKSFAPNKDKE